MTGSQNDCQFGSSTRLAMAGTDRGIMMRHQMPYSGKAVETCRFAEFLGDRVVELLHQEHPNAPNACRMMSDHSVFDSLNSETRTNCGIMNDCHGTAMVPM